MTQYALLSYVVNATVVGVVAPGSPNRVYFNGVKPPGSVNFLDPTNAAAFTNLFQHLVQFFGQALGCNDPTFPAYAGNPNLQAVHAPMMISMSDSDAFNSVLIGVLASAGVTASDQAFVQSYLNSQTSNIVSSGAAQPPTSGLQPWQIGVIAAVGLAVVVAIIVTVVCCIRRQGKEGGQYVAF